MPLFLRKKVESNTDIPKVYLVTFVANLQFFGAVSIPFFIDLGGLNYKKIFILESFYTLFLFATEIPNGIFSDKFSRKNALSLGLFFLGIGYVIFSFSRNFNFFILAEFFCALGASFLSGSDKALLYELLKKRSLEAEAKKYLARMQGWGTLGMAIGLPLGSFLARSTFFSSYPESLSVTFLLSAFASLGVAIITLSIKEEPIERCKKKFLKIGYESLIFLYKNKRLLQLCLNLILVNAPVFFIVWLYQPILAKFNLDVKYFGIVACIFNLFGVLLLRHVNKLVSVFGVKNLLFYSGLLPGAIFMMIPFVNGAFACVLLIIFAAGIRSVRTPIINHYINSEIWDENRATILSTISTMQRVVLFFLNPVVGYLCDISVNYALFFLGTCIILICLCFRKKEKIFTERAET
ncbi:MAG: MFS transporter [Chlamydiales bacterium]|nr:MFS transporter [Chlamydiales bacterium]